MPDWTSGRPKCRRWARTRSTPSTSATTTAGSSSTTRRGRRSNGTSSLRCTGSLSAMPDSSDESQPRSATAQDLHRWTEALAGIARTGLGFTQNLYEKERFEEILAVAADMAHAAGGGEFDHDHKVEEWLGMVGEGVPGYVTPKVAVAAIVGNDDEQILLVQRADSGVWLYPTGWADIGYSPSEIAVKEVREETGIEIEVVRMIGVLDGLRLGFTRIPMYLLLFHCRAIGGK